MAVRRREWKEAPSKRIWVRELKTASKEENALRGAGEWAGTVAQDRLMPLSETGMARSNHR